MENQNIRVLVARTIEAVDAGQCDDVKECDSLKEAREFAKYALTDAYQASGEFSAPMGYSRVMRGDECVNDYFRKEPKPFGYDVEIRIHGEIEPKRCHWQGSEATMLRKARLQSRFEKILSMTPYTREQWVRTYGLGRM